MHTTTFMSNIPPEISRIIDDYLCSKKVYIPIIIHGREKYEYHANTCGVFVNKTNATNALIDKLIEMQFIDYYTFMKTRGDRNEDDSDEEENEKYNIKSLSEFTNLIKLRANKNASNLHYLCQEFGDSFYEDGWKFEIVEHVVS